MHWQTSLPNSILILTNYFGKYNAYWHLILQPWDYRFVFFPMQYRFDKMKTDIESSEAPLVWMQEVRIKIKATYQVLGNWFGHNSSAESDSQSCTRICNNAQTNTFRGFYYQYTSLYFSHTHPPRWCRLPPDCTCLTRYFIQTKLHHGAKSCIDNRGGLPTTPGVQGNTSLSLTPIPVSLTAGTFCDRYIFKNCQAAGPCSEVSFSASQWNYRTLFHWAPLRIPFFSHIPTCRPSHFPDSPLLLHYHTTPVSANWGEAPTAYWCT